MKSRAAVFVLLVLAVAVTGCDQGTKRWAERDLAGARPAAIVPGKIDLLYTRNPGVAFNLERVVPAPARKPLVLAAGLAMLALVLVAGYRRRHDLSAATIGLALIAGGALGNLLDRFTRGYVVDFIHIHGWPVFNVADMAICTGAALIVLRGVTGGRPARPAPP